MWRTILFSQSIPSFSLAVSHLAHPPPQSHRIHTSDRQRQPSTPTASIPPPRAAACPQDDGRQALDSHLPASALPQAAIRQLPPLAADPRTRPSSGPASPRLCSSRSSTTSAASRGSPLPGPSRPDSRPPPTARNFLQKTFTVGINTYGVRLLPWSGLFRDFKCCHNNSSFPLVLSECSYDRVADRANYMSLLTLLKDKQLSFWPSTVAAAVVALPCLATGCHHAI